MTQTQNAAGVPAQTVPDPRRRILDLVQETGDTLARLDAEDPGRLRMEREAILGRARVLVDAIDLDADDFPSRFRDAATVVADAHVLLPRLERRQRAADRWRIQNPGGGDAA